MAYYKCRREFRFCHIFVSLERITRTGGVAVAVVVTKRPTTHETALKASQLLVVTVLIADFAFVRLGLSGGSVPW